MKWMSVASSRCWLLPLARTIFVVSLVITRTIWYDCNLRAKYWLMASYWFNLPFLQTLSIPTTTNWSLDIYHRDYYYVVWMSFSRLSGKFFSSFFFKRWNRWKKNYAKIFDTLVEPWDWFIQREGINRARNWFLFFPFSKNVWCDFSRCSGIVHHDRWW